MLRIIVLITVILTLLEVNNLLAEDVLLSPEQIALDGNKRIVDLASPTGSGRIKLRWQREVEQMFNKSPERAVIEALQATARVLKTAGFPSKLQNLNLDWNIVFLDSELSTTEVPAQLISNCHPGWMRPPADIYIVAERVVSGCAEAPRVSGEIANADLAELLLHEIGHVVEHAFHDQRLERSAFRSEGFATWFATFAADYSSMIPRGSVIQEQKIIALKSLHESPNNFIFQGSALDYARSSMYFHALVDKKRVHGLMRVYDTMLSKQLDFHSAVKDVFGWDAKQYNLEVTKFLSQS